MLRPDSDRIARYLRASPAGRSVASLLGAAWMRFVHVTTRWTVVGVAHRDELLAERGPILAAFWHGRLFFSPFWVPPGRRTMAVISNNNDGALIADTVARFGVESVRGSSNDPRKPDRDKGGREAFTRALAGLEAGAVVGITPDGPRGPRMRAQPGVAALSIASGAPVMPIGCATRRGRLTRGWDRFLIPRPFDEGVVVYGPILHPPAGGDDAGAEAYRLAIETAITAATEEADRRMGRAPVAAT